MSPKITGFLIFACLLASLAACGKDTPQEPDDSLPADTTGVDTTGTDTTGIDTTASKTPYLIPFAQGARWKYALNYTYMEIKYGGVAYEANHYGSYSLEVISADVKNKNYVLRGRFTLDSLVVNSHALLPDSSDIPVNPDTTIDWNIITLRDTLWYDLGDRKEMFMRWHSPVSFIDLRVINYPWQSRFTDFSAKVYSSDFIPPDEIAGYDNILWLENIVYFDYGWTQGHVVRALGGITDFTAVYSPGLISDHTVEYLTYKLLDYTPGTP